MKLLAISLTTAQAAWANWEQWEDCAGECFEGRRTRVRQCIGWACENECQFQPGEICDHLQTERGCLLHNFCTWDQWSDWSTCTETCGGGTQQRERQCHGSHRPADHCGGGDTFQNELCNSNPCVTYTFGDWADWSGCSATCGGGTKSRTRDCFDDSGNLATGNCNGESTDSATCASNDCSECEFNQWTGYYVTMTEYWEWVNDEDITSINDCSAYCAAMSDCKAFYYESSSWSTDCRWSTSAEVRSSSAFSSTSSYSAVFGLFSTEDSSQANLPQVSPSREPCGVVNAACLSMNTDFGAVKYKDITNVAFEPMLYEYIPEVAEKFVIRDASSADCAKKCWETAGCSSYFVTNECNMVMGSVQSCDSSWAGGETCPDPADVVESGRLSNFCNNNDAFSSSFVKKSTFYCELITQIEEDELIQQIKNDNGIGSSVTLGSWTFSTRSTSPLSKQSQLIDIFVENPYGVANTQTQAEWTWIQFTFETYIRTANSASSGRKKRSDDFFDIDADAINRVLTSLNLPAGVTVNQTTEPEVLEFVQITPSGDVAADCSSGACVCEDGFVDNGSGCEFSPSENEEPENGRVLAIIRETVENVLDEATLSGKTQDKKRRNLKRAWTNIFNRVENKSRRIKQKNCQVGDVDTTRFDLSGNVCELIEGAANGLDYYAEKYTNDCTKEKRGKNLAFYGRISNRLGNLSDRVKQNLAAGNNC